MDFDSLLSQAYLILKKHIAVLQIDIYFIKNQSYIINELAPSLEEICNYCEGNIALIEQHFAVLQTHIEPSDSQLHLVNELTFAN